LGARHPGANGNSRRLSGRNDRSADQQPASPGDIDRDKAHSLGVSADQIENALYDAMASAKVLDDFCARKSILGNYGAAPEYQRDPAALASFTYTRRAGSSCPCVRWQKISRGVGPLTVNHFGQLPSVTISFNLEPGKSLGPAVDASKNRWPIFRPATFDRNFRRRASVPISLKAWASSWSCHPSVIDRRAERFPGFEIEGDRHGGQLAEMVYRERPDPA